MRRFIYVFVLVISLSHLGCGDQGTEKPGTSGTVPRKPGPGPGGLSVPNSKSLNIATLTLDDPSTVSSRKSKKSTGYIKRFLTKHFQTHDILVFFNVVEVAEFIEKVAHRKFNCGVYKNPLKRDKYKNMVICNNPKLKIVKNGVSSSRIDPVGLGEPEIYKPAFQSLYKFQDGFKFHLVVVHLKSNVQSYFSRKTQIEKLTSFLESEDVDAPLLVVGHWNNIPEVPGQSFNCAPGEVKTEENQALSELNCHKKELAIYDPSIKILEGENRTVIESGRHNGYGLKYNSVMYSSSTWSGVRPIEMDHCKSETGEIDKNTEDYIKRISSHCLVSFKLKKN